MDTLKPRLNLSTRTAYRLISSLALGTFSLQPLGLASLAWAQNIKPDLTPPTMSASALQFPLNACTARAFVVNRGFTAAPSSHLTISNQVNPDGSVSARKVSVPQVPAKTANDDGSAYSSWISNFKIFSNTPFVPFRIRVDSDNQIFEGSPAAEGNNSKDFTYNVANSPAQLWNGIPAGCIARPDLRVTQFDWNPSTCALELTVQNVGEADTSFPNSQGQLQDFFVSIQGLRDNSTGNSSWAQKIPRLKKGETFSTTITGYRADTNFDFTRVIADSTQVLTESEEVLNQREIVPPMKCYYNPPQECDIFINSYGEYNTIEKLHHINDTNTIEPVDYWTGAENQIIQDIAATQGDAAVPDDVRVIRRPENKWKFGFEKIRFLSNHKFDYQPGFSQAINLGFDGGHIDPPTDPNSTEPPQLYFLNDKKVLKSPINQPASAVEVASIEGATGTPTNETFENGMGLDNVYFKGRHFVSYYRSGDDTVLSRVMGTSKALIGVLRTASGAKPRITGLAMLGPQLYALSQSRVIYRVDPDTAILTSVMPLPSTIPGTNIAFGKGFGMAAKCATLEVQP